MKKRKKVLFLTFGIVILLIIVASATSQYWGKLSFKTQNTKGKFFKINLLGEPAAKYELTPGDSFTIEPVIENLGTEDICCFITIRMRRVSNNTPAFSLSIYDPDYWQFIKQENFEREDKNMCTLIYAYSYYKGGYSQGVNLRSLQMEILSPGLSTPKLTDRMTLSVGLTDFSMFDNDDVNVVVSGIGVALSQLGDISTDPESVWGLYLTMNGDDEDEYTDF